MEHTADLFDPAPPIARKRDPDTSKAAAIEYSKTRRSGDCQTLFNLVKEIPNQTTSEYADVLMGRGMKPMTAQRMPSRRMSDLLADGRVAVGKVRKCRMSNRRAQTYYVREDYL